MNESLEEFEKLMNRRFKDYNFILDDNNNVIPCDNIIEWSDWRNANRSRININMTKVGELRVSTIFLGHKTLSFSKEPMVFETMVFDEFDFPVLDICERYSTYQEAMSGHKKIVKELKSKP